jgi:hypothetical protein
MESTPSPEARAGEAHLTTLVTRVAEAGRLRVSVPLAVKTIQAGGSGVAFTLIATPPKARDPTLSTMMREAVLSAILVKAEVAAHDERGRVAARAVALRAVLSEASAVLSPGETQVMGEWLDRLSMSGAK